MDARLLLWLNGSDSVYLDSVMWDISSVALWVPLYIALVWLIWRNKRGAEALVIIALIALTIVVADQVASSVFKPYFHRLRPTHEPSLAGQVDTVRGYMGGLYGFISSHAANTFALATFITLVVRHFALTLTLYFWALLTCYSRAYLGVHYPGDLLAGALFGSLVATLFYGLYLTLQPRLTTTTSYTSTAFTSTGYQTHDALFVIVVFIATLLFTLFKAIYVI